MSKQGLSNLWAASIGLLVSSGAIAIVSFFVSVWGADAHRPHPIVWFGILLCLVLGTAGVAWAIKTEGEFNKAELRAAVNTAEPRFEIGDPVCKPKGYPYDGVVVAVFENLKGDTRYVVELDRGVNGDMLHIFNETQLEARDT